MKISIDSSYKNKHTGQLARIISIDQVALCPTKSLPCVTLNLKEHMAKWRLTDFQKHWEPACPTEGAAIRKTY